MCEELCICALPERLEPSHLNYVVILWFMSWYRCVPNQKDLGWFAFVFVFVFLGVFPLFLLPNWNQIVLKILVVYVLTIYDKWKLSFSLTEGGPGKARPLEDPQTEFLLVSTEMGRGETRGRGFMNYWWFLTAEICCPCWAVTWTVVMLVTPAELCSVGVETWCSFSVDVTVNF